VTVCTHKVALGDLIENRKASNALPEKIADFARFVGAGQMIPLHGCMVIRRTTVGARSVLLESPIPRSTFIPTLLAHLKAFAPRSPPVGRVVLTPTRLAPCLSSMASSMELINGLGHAASPAPLVHVVRLEYVPDSDT
jgi:hypothetical protein